MSRPKKLGILCGILAAAVLALVLVMNGASRKDGEETGEPMLAIPSERISEIAWTYGGETLHFVRHGDAWVCPENETFPVDSSRLENMLGTLGDVRSYKEIRGNANHADYGLDPAVLALTVTADRTYDLKIGNETDLDGRVYAETDGTVFLTDSMLRSQFSKQMLDMVLQEPVPEMDKVQSVEIRRGNETLTLEYDDSGERTYYSGYVWLGSEGGAAVPLETGSVESLLSSLTTLRWTGTAVYPAEDSSLDDTGLREPDAAVTVQYRDRDGKEGRFLLAIGAETESGECYAMIPGSDRIYTTGASLKEALTGTTLEDLLPKEVLAVDWNSVKSMTVSLGGTEHVLTRAEENDSMDDAETGKQVWKEAGSDRTVDLTEAIRGLCALQGESVVESNAREVLLTVTLERNTANYPQVIVTMQETPDGEVGVLVNGTQYRTVDRTSAEEVLEQFHGAFA